MGKYLPNEIKAGPQIGNAFVTIGSRPSRNFSNNISSKAPIFKELKPFAYRLGSPTWH